jgi:hypothetical protein
MSRGDPIREGQILTGQLFSEPMRVETVTPNGPSAWTVGAVGTQTERYRRVALTKDQPATLTITSQSTIPTSACPCPGSGVDLLPRQLERSTTTCRSLRT